jgi:membrane dipeptidase
MEEGGLDVAFFAAYNSGYAQEGRANSRILALLNALYWNGRMNEKTFAIATSSKEIEELVKDRKVGVPSIEGSYSLETYNYKGLLQQYYDLGVRMNALIWSNSNSLGGGVNNRRVDEPSTVINRLGLTELGVKVVQEMDRLGMVIDVAHMNTETFWGVMAAAKGPVIASHSCVRELWNDPNATVGGERGTPRNLWDDQIIAIAKSGGTVQINFYPSFIGPTGRNGVKELVDHIDYVVKLVGIDYVGFGSDFDGASMPADMPTAAFLYKITEQLVDRGYSKKDIEKILGLNMMRVLKEVEAKAEKLAEGPKIAITPDLSLGDSVTSRTPLLTARVVNNGVAANVSSFKAVVDGIEYTPAYNSTTGVLSLQVPQPLVESFHVVTFEGASTNGVITRETRIFYINAP